MGSPFPAVPQAERDLSTTLGTRGRPGHLGCWVGHRALARSVGVLMAWLGFLMTLGTVDFSEF